jgi:hypothetical protein
MHNHLDERAADLEDVLLLQLAPYYHIQILVEVVEDAVEVALVLHNLSNVGYFLNLVVIHEGDVFVLEDLLPGGLPVQLLDSRQFAGLRVFGAEEGVPFGLDYLVEQAVLLHAINFINILRRAQPNFTHE